MGEAPPNFSSPAGPAETTSDGAGLELTDLSGCRIQIFNAEATTGSPRVAVGFAARKDNSLEFSVGPGEWFVITLPGALEAREAASTLWFGVGEAATGAGLDNTHGRVLYRLSGADARWALEKVCALDFDDRFMPDGGAGRTSVAKIVGEVVRLDEDGLPSYLIICGRSFGSYLWEALLDAAAEFNGKAVEWDRRSL